MSGSLKPYPKYKESGVEWLGAVPEEWEIKRVGHLTQYGVDGIKIGPFGSAIKLDMMVDESDGFPVVGQENVINNDFSNYRRYLPCDLKDRFSVYEVLPEDALITMMGTSGRCAIVPDTNPFSIIDSHLMRVRLNHSVSTEFFQRVFDEAPYIKTAIQLFSKGSIMAGLNSGIVANIPIALPPLPAQQAIADYLDDETQRIDTLIAELREMIRLLKEKRRALISRCVTKGLDPTVPMKDSGVEWLGEVPEGWEVTTLGRIAARVQTGPFGSQIHSYEYVSGGVPLINPAHIVGGEIMPDMDCTVTGEQAAELVQYRLQNGDIVLGRRGEMGRCATVSDESSGFLIGTGSLSIRLHEGQESAYWSKFLSIPMIRDWLALEANGSTILDLNATIVSRVPIVAPPAEEQRAIATHLDTETAKIDRLISETEDTITLMQERRSALIGSVVTGKLQVPDIAEPSGSTLNSRPESLR
jgi:type I restriction enzyme S subunit